MKNLTAGIPFKSLEVAQKTALLAGQKIENVSFKREDIQFKGDIDLVTHYDRECQEIIISEISKAFPQHSIIAEEDQEILGDGNFRWLIDPIDGTTNFAHGLPIYCISIALLQESVPLMGVVYIPPLQQLFHATKNGGSYLNGKPIKVSRTENIGDALLATGFPYDRRESNVNNLDYFQSFILQCRGIRRMGSAAIDLCYTAAGIFDGYWELKLKPWDSAAGAIILKEAGGQITGIEGEPFDPFNTYCLGSNSIIHHQMVDIIARTDTVF